MSRRHFLLLSGLIAGTLAGGWQAADLAAQDEPDTPQAQEDQPNPGDRRGGIPRDWLEEKAQPQAQDEAQPEARSRSFGKEGNDAEGFDEGVPEFRVDPGFRPPDDEFFPPRSDWKLGVRAENTDTGVVVTRVVPGSAAARGGLERGDRIVTVSGHQIGFVGRELFPLGHELQRRAGRRGEVLLLVQNVRGNELLNVDVRLDRAGPGRPRASEE